MLCVHIAEICDSVCSTVDRKNLSFNIFIFIETKLKRPLGRHRSDMYL